LSQPEVRGENAASVDVSCTSTKGCVGMIVTCPLDGRCAVANYALATDTDEWPYTEAVTVRARNYGVNGMELACTDANCPEALHVNCGTDLFATCRVAMYDGSLQCETGVVGGMNVGISAERPGSRVVGCCADICTNNTNSSSFTSVIEWEFNALFTNTELPDRASHVVFRVSRSPQ